MNCPKCNAKMVKRDGKYGPFWGCSKFPKCRTIVNINQVGPQQLRKIQNPSKYQQNIFDWVVNGSGNAVVSAAAGSGKTTTIEHVVAILKETQPNAEVIYAVFNSHVQRSAADKGLPAMTTHSIGLQAITQHLGRKPKIDDRKVYFIVKDLLQQTWEQDRWMVSIVCNIVGKLKNTLAPQDNDTLDKICDRFGIETNGSASRIYEVTRAALVENNRIVDVVDFDDMIYFPHLHKMSVKQYDWVLADEVQDFNRAQINLIIKSLKPNGRTIQVGDRRQSMYAFRGAAIDAMDNITEAFNAIEMPLSITYRCPALHVELVNTLFPEIPFEKFEGAKQGQIQTMSIDRMLGEVRNGDLVLCRTNAPLVAPVFSLIRQGVKAVIRGRDIGQGLISLIERFNSNTVSEFLVHLAEYETKEVIKLLNAEKTSQAQSLQDKVETIVALSDRCTYVSEIITKINEVFSDKNEGVVFSTVHKAKGDEAENVYILNPQLMPHKMATKEWEIIQEYNILYVALSRSKNKLSFVGGHVPGAEVKEIEEPKKDSNLEEEEFEHDILEPDKSIIQVVEDDDEVIILNEEEETFVIAPKDEYYQETKVIEDAPF